MKTYGIRLLDGKGNVLKTTLHDILDEIDGGESFYWCLLFLDGIPAPGQGSFLVDFEKKINDSKNGIIVTWEELKRLSIKFFQMFEITVLGCKDVDLLHRFDNENDMYKACDIVIDLGTVKK